MREAIERRIGWTRELLAEGFGDPDPVVAHGLLQAWLRRYEMDCSALLKALEGRGG